MKRGYFIAIIVLAIILVAVVGYGIYDLTGFAVSHECSDSDASEEDPYLVVGFTSGGDSGYSKYKSRQDNKTDYCVLNTSAVIQEEVGKLAEFYCGENGIVKSKYVDCAEVYGEGVRCEGNREDGMYGRCVFEGDQYCGDKSCDEGEDCLTCVTDCGKCTDCFDNDEAFDFIDSLKTFGNCDDGGTLVTDYCQGHIVWEAYCDERGVKCLQKTGYNCKTLGFSGCEGGKCVE